MCFSATASFATAAIISAVGAITVWKTARSGNIAALPFAAIPLMFALQQIIEGMIWIDLAEPMAGNCRPVLIQGFVGYAEVFWPVFAPLTVFLIEPLQQRRRYLLGVLIAGIALATWMLAIMVAHPYQVTIHVSGLVYRNGYPYPWIMWPVYVFTTSVTFTLSSFSVVRIFGLVVIVGLVVAAIAFNRAYVSVWCFFAAAASLLVFLHVRRQAKT